MGKKKHSSRDQRATAIVGLSLRLPGSPDAETLMDNLEAGFDAIAEIPGGRWPVASTYDPDPSAPGKSISKWCGLLDGVEEFDNRFFNLAPAEAAIMDPQQRLLLEEVWRCVENSGLGFDRLRRIRTGVYVGFMATDFLQALAAPELETQAGHALGGYACGLAGRVSYALGLSGPSVPLDAACASSLVALHQARRALLDGEIDAAIVAGVSLNLAPWKYVSFSKARMLSPTGRCRTFDAAADGYVPGDGVVATLLLRAGDARKAGATIHALVRGSAVNHCGDSVFITAPSVTAQEEVIADAIAESGVAAERITYVEAHGTGTSLGDPIEVEGLRRAFARFTPRTGFARIGSIKSNVGHLEGAAGLAGLAKLVMMMRRRVMVPTVNLATVNPVIDFGRTPFSPALRREEWRPARPGAPLAAGLSSFGMSGTNAHAVLTSDTGRSKRRKKAEPPGLFLLSARTPEALDEMASAWRRFAGTGATAGATAGVRLGVPDICGTLATGRAAFRHRAGLLLSPGDDPAEAVSGLRRREASAGPWAVLLRDASGVGPHDGGSGTLDALYRKARPKGKLWETSDPRVGGLRHSLALLGALERLGFAPRRLAGEGAGLWAALVASGQITGSEAVRAICNPKAAGRIRPRRPTVPFFDPVAGAWRRPLVPDADYVSALVEGLRASAPRLTELARPIRPLAEHQPTFQRFLAPWEDLKASDPADRELIRSLALRDAMRQLGRRWQLSQAPDRLDPRAAEAEALLAGGILGREILVQLLEGADPAGVAARLADAFAGDEPAEDFPLLAGRSGGERIGDLAGWIADAERAPRPPPEDADLRWLVLGGASAPSVPAAAREPSPPAARLPEALCLDLWLEGTDLRWEKVFPDRSFRRVEVPGTAFRRDRFPIGRSGLVRAGGTEPAPPPPRRPPPAAGLSHGRLYRPAWEREAAAPTAAAFETVMVLGADDARRTELAGHLARTGAPVWTGGLDPAFPEPPAGRWAMVLLLPGDTDDADAMLDGPVRGLFGVLKRLGATERLTLVSVAPAGVTAGLAAGWLAALSAERAFGAVRAVELDGGTLGMLPDLAAAAGFARIALRPDGAWRFGLAEERPRPAASPRSLDGTWIVTGGAGALGLTTASALAARGADAVLLLGRRAAPPVPAEMRAGGRIHYRACDVTSAVSLGRVLEEARSRGPIRGVIHGAGVLDDRLFAGKDWDGFRSVVAPKLAGALLLDRLTRGDPLALFAAYASVVGVFGNVGQTDYAAANSALDALVRRRIAEGAPGRSISLDWGLWRGAGMDGADAEGRFDRMGLPPLDPAAGSAILGSALDLNLEGQWVALGGPMARPAGPEPAPALSRPASGEADAEAIARYLAGRIAAFTGQGPDRIAPEDSFFELGVGSVQLMELTQDLSRHFAGVTPTLPFQRTSIARMAAFLAGQPVLEPLPGRAAGPPRSACAIPARVEAAAPARREKAFEPDAVAIVGMAGRYPDSETLPRFWQALSDGRDCVRPAPPERRGDGGAARVPPGQRGGWLADVEAFDPLFFNISFREAEQMDPQQRLMLEVAWETLEDAGYARRGRRAGSSVGLFVGVMWNEYSLHTREHRERTGAWGGPGSLYWAIANRVSYALDLTGPSMAVDTACSSSLTALHLAVQSIVSGDCDMALAGGVNLSIHPSKYDYLREGRFLSSEGLCRSFGEGGDGYVPGEGVGAVLLKPLARALADGDRIHGVVRGTSVNHGGRAAGFTVPNPTAQATLVRRALHRAGVSPAEIGYVECHGTGTALGDPIEIAALAEAFGPGLPGGSIPIGSVKSNIGHLEAAAGIAAVSKVLLALSHGWLPKSLHAEVRNARIDFAATPFRVLDAGERWQGPRRAAVSSFGAGGANAHAVIEAGPPPPVRAPASGTLVFPLSARTGDSLGRFARALRDALSGLDLRDVAHTLRTGREDFAVRAVVLAGHPDVLADALDALARGEGHPALRTGRAEDGVAPPAVDAAGLGTEALAEAWASGAAVVWPPVAEGRMVGLPTYRFARERYWVGGLAPAPGPAPAPAAGRRFTFDLAADHMVVAHHVVGGRRILPAAAGLEMMRSALARLGHGPAQLLDLAWVRPVAVEDGPKAVAVSAGDAGDGLVAVSLGDDGGISVHARADTRPPPPVHDSIPAAGRALDPAEAYRAFARMGLAYGPAFQAIRELRLGDAVAVARLERPECWGPPEQGEVLPPGLVDAGLQTALALLAGPGGADAFLPVTMGRVAWWRPMPHRVTAVVRLAPGEGRLRHADIRFLDDDGMVVAALDRVGLLRVDVASAFPPAAALAFSREAWRDAPGKPAPPAPLLLVAPRDELDAWSDAATARGMGRDGLVALDRARPDGGRLAPLAGAPVRALFVAGADDDGRALLALTQALMAAGLHDVDLVAAFPSPVPGARPLSAALGGFARSLRTERPDYRFRVAEVVDDDARRWREAALDELALSDSGAAELRLAHGSRLVRVTETLPPPPPAVPFTADAGGVHLITGGLGGLGLLFAGWLADRGARRIALLGRSAPSADARAEIDALTARGVDVLVTAADLSLPGETERAVSRITAELGPIVGVIHSAGVTRDGLVRGKRAEDWETVLAPKVAGTLALDRATQGQPLGYFVLFSSISGILGNPGQADYAFANRFLDAFAEWREGERRAGRRRGRTQAIDWPLWRMGRGMGAGLDDAAMAGIRDAMGTEALTPSRGFAAFEAALALGEPQILVTLPVEGKAAPAVAASGPPGRSPVDEARLGAALAYVTEKLCRETRIPADRIGSRRSFEEFGIDSVMVVNLTRSLEADFGPLPKTLFFEYRNPAGLAAHLAELRPDLFGASPPAPSLIPSPTTAPTTAPPPTTAPTTVDEPIAVIGLAGRYPKAPDLERFWLNLKEGVDAITEVPAERWDHSALFDPGGRDGGAVYGKWGGFLDGIDLFDPLVFGISPKDARLMDPQERLFLETARHALEDAGYAAQSLSRQVVGVFAGAMWGQYELLGAGAAEGPVPSSSFAGIANRVSFCLDLTGPSLTVDTMCSSSLTAVHLAIESLRRGECAMALAGGVNLTIDPNKYRQLAQGRFLSTDGRCRSFGEGGDGYVPGEGVGVAVLKPLSAAQADGDRIMAVLRGNAINHGGRGNGFTVPGVDAQAGAVAGALGRSGVPAESISYIETHGTGTSLGDPIEIAGLAKAFRAAGVPDGWRCAIGSAKSSIGHLEAAAGIAGLTKLVLQLDRGELAPSLHADTLNSNIEWDKVPFRLQRRAGPWFPARRPDGGPWPRRAGLSSFGAGGSNAHLVVEEYLAPARTPDRAAGPVLLPLSARTPASLRQAARQLLDALPPAGGGEGAESAALAALADVLGTGTGDISIDDHPSDLGMDQAALLDWIGRLDARFGTRLTLEFCASAPSLKAIVAQLPPSSEEMSPVLADIAFTLQTGREQMAERLALVAADVAQVRAALAAFLDGRTPAGLHLGRATRAPVDAGTRVARALANGDLAALAALWVEGGEVPWPALHGNARRRRVRLPPYPYERQRYWYEPATPASTPPAPAPSVPAGDEAARMADWEIRARSWTGDAVTLETVEGEIALVTMQDRANRNMFTDDLVLGLVKAFAAIREEARHKAVVVTGADGVFSMGATPRILTDIAESRARFSDIPFMYRGLLDCDVPVIAAIQGHASGGGLLFGLYADMVVMAEESLFSAVFTRYGFTPGMGATLILKERLGANVATRMMYTGQSFAGSELKALGAQAIFAPAAEVGVQALSLARSLADKPRETLKTLKRELAGRLLAELPAVIEKELAMHAATFGSDEVRRRLDRLTRQPEPEPEPEAGAGTRPAPAGRLRLRPLAAADHAATRQPAPPQPIRLAPLAAAPADSAPMAAPVAAPVVATVVRAEAGDIAGALAAMLARTLQMDPKDIPGDVPFLDLGLDSIGGVELVHAINARFATRLEAADLYDHPTLQRLAAALAATVAEHAPAVPGGMAGEEAPPVPPPLEPGPEFTPELDHAAPPSDAIAVIGMACRYPGADDAGELWDLLLAGADRVAEIPADRWEVAGFYDPDPEADRRCVSKWGGFLDDVAGFDAEFFGLSPMEAEIMDPQQRIVLEECWHALENAAIAADTLSAARCGVFMGAAAGDYEELVRQAGQDGTAHAFLGLSPSILSARIAYHLNLKGPCLAMDTACSSSLVAVHEACRSLKDGESDLALAGGVIVMSTPRLHLRSGKTGMLSPTGRCRPFDAGADGIALAEGVGVVVLKRLSRALADGDPIRAVIRGSGMNQDGRTNGITAPSARSQAELEARVLDQARVAAATIGYVETHGTGTPLGDPIEVKALAETFRDCALRAGTCALGSVKANIGHATVAAGIAGLIKAVLCVETGLVPPMPHFRQPNPRIDLGATPFFINRETVSWPRPGLRRAAVSAFGFSGTNAHVVLEQAPPAPAPAPGTSPVLIPVSSRTGTALARAVRNLARVLRRSDAPALADVAHTLILGRQPMPERAAFVAGDLADLVRQLDAWRPGDGHRGGNGPLHAAARAWADGAEIDLRPLAPPGRRIGLPGYPFDHQRHWLAPVPAAGVPRPENHPLIPVREADGFSARFTGDEFFLADHVATERRILPAAAFLEMAVAACRAVTGRLPAGLAELAWSVPVEERDGAVPPVRLRFRGEAFTVTAGLDGADETVCTGEILAGQPVAPASENPEAIAGRCPRRVAGADIYRAFRAKGLIHGPGFRWIEEAWAGDGEALVRLRVPATDEPFVLHPGRLDAALQGVILLIDPDLGDRSLHLPVRMARVTLHHAPAGAAWAHIRRSPDPADGDDRRSFDVRIMDRDGRLLVAVDGFTLRRVERAAASLVLLAPIWREAELDRPAGEVGRVLLVTGDAGLSSAAASRGLATALPGEAAIPDDTQAVILVLAGGDDPALALAAGHGAATGLLRRGGEARLLLASRGDGGPDPVPASAGFLRSLMKESERIGTGALSLGSLGADAAIDALLAELHAPSGSVARIENGRRMSAALAETVAGIAAAPWREGGHYLITGGMGRLGLAVAESLAGRCRARLTLVGRRPAGPAEIAAIDRAGGEALPLAIDIAAPDGARAAVERAKARFGAIHGVIHAAGLVRDSMLRAKPLDDALAVLAPKAAVGELDRVLAEEPLDLFVLFSSIAASLGWPGQTDYAFANGWLDGFAEWRDAECRAGRRSGRTISVQWPYWADGGMKMDAETFEAAAGPLGVVPLTIPDGLAALDAALATGGPVVMPLVGNAPDIRRHFLTAAPAGRVRAAPGAHPTELAGRLHARLAAEVEGLLKLPPARIAPDRRLTEYGFDSITLTRFANRLNRQFGLNLSPALFFERPSLASLGEALLERHGAAMAAHLGTEEAAAPAVLPAPPHLTPRPEPAPRPEPGTDDAVAIVGMAGMMPGSKDLDAFWEHLAACDDLVTEIPSDRWDWRRHADRPGASKWGAFLDRVDLFDARFFGISPREAELMDPQQRLFIETVWHAIEDSGQRPGDLAGSDTGLFVGVATSDYWELLQSSGIAVEAHTATGNSHSLLPNRISYLLDLRGPSEPVDTACSSSLVALARAADAIRRGDCGMAIVGGVNIMLTPSLYVAFGKAGMLSPDGRCKTFDESANGYVRGEGVGAVVLKPLSRALADGNRVHAVLRGWAVNHGGRAASLTAPNPNAQARAIQAALAHAGIDPSGISYVETHGTGTPLGDPVEVEGLKMVFRDADRPPCWLGSVKSVVGHLEAAAGIAGLIKVLLAMRHGTLPGNGLLKRLNPHIHLDGSPLRVLTETRPWDGARPLRAGISSFGFGGANAHVVVESFDAAGPPRLPALPPTSFRRRRYWPEAARAAPAPEAALVDKMLFQADWVPAAGAADVVPEAGGVLVAVEGADETLVAMLGRRHAGSAMQVTPLAHPSIPEGLRHVHILLDSRPGGSGADDAGAERPLPLALFRLLRGLLAHGYAERELDITLVASGAVAPPVGRPAAAACFAVLRAAGREHPRWTVRCLDLDPESADPAAGLAALLARDDGADDFGRPLAVRNGRVLRRVLRPARLPAVPSPWGRDGAYVIVGGAGGVGGLFARTLAREAKARIALVGRRAPDSGIGEVLAAIGRDGGEGMYVQADAADPRALEDALVGVEASLGPIGCIVHGAMTLDDRPFARMTEDAFLGPFRSKAAVAQSLAGAARRRDAELLFFSSVQTLLCNAGQANYAAGCAWQDALADHLGAEGLPVRVVQWGYWGEVGAVATPAHRARMAELGVGSVGPAEGMAALGRMVAGGVSSLVVAAGTPQALAALGVVEDDDPPPPALSAALEALELASRQAALTALAEAGAFDLGGEWRTVERARGALGVAARQERLFAALVDMLAASGLLERDGDRLRLTPAGRDAANREALERSLAGTAGRHPAVAAHIGLLRHCADALAAVLSGRSQGTDVLLPGGAMTLIEPIYRGNEIADRQNRAVAEWIRREVAAKLESGAGPLRLVEIGAGTGGTSAFVLETLADRGDAVGYWYTDVSKAFLQHGWRQFHPNHSFTRFEVLDITRPPPEETFPRHGYDIVLAANVLHAVPDIRAGISHLAQLLKGGGCLVLNELTAVQSFNTVTFGQLDGWWAATDSGRRLSNTPLLSLAGWRRELGDAGFSIEKVRDDGLGLTVLLARYERRTEPAAVPAEHPAAKAPPVRPSRPGGEGTVHDAILDTLAGVLLMDRAEIDPARSYVDHGVDSILAVETAKQLGARLGIELRPTDLFNHPTVDRLAEHIARTFAPADGLAAPSGPAPALPADGDGDDDPLMRVLLGLQRGEVSVEEAEALLEPAP
jgi:acyl transferase domain-containing protein/NAD(P)-dependent dehydrogenase (short-subunit alcohol dehydrogenase family)/acyl carrier protein/SAM-dependent methyltransferase